MANPALGTKRLCIGCSAKFYDLGKNPIVCPTCETVFVVPKVAPPRTRSVFDPRNQPARHMGTLAEAEIAPAVAGDAEPEDAEETPKTEEADDGVPMLEDIDEK